MRQRDIAQEPCFEEDEEDECTMEEGLTVLESQRTKRNSNTGAPLAEIAEEVTERRRGGSSWW